MTCPSCRAHQNRAVAMRRVALQSTQQVTDPRRRRDLNRLITAIGEDLPHSHQHTPAIRTTLGRTQRDLLRRLAQGTRTIPQLATPNRDATIRALTSLAVRGYTQRHHDGTWGLTSIGHATIHQPEADT